MTERGDRPVHYSPTRYVPSSRRRSTPAPAPRAQTNRGDVVAGIVLGILVAIAALNWLGVWR